MITVTCDYCGKGDYTDHQSHKFYRIMHFSRGGHVDGESLHLHLQCADEIRQHGKNKTTPSTEKGVVG